MISGQLNRMYLLNTITRLVILVLTGILNHIRRYYIIQILQSDSPDSLLLLPTFSLITIDSIKSKSK